MSIIMEMMKRYDGTVFNDGRVVLFAEFDAAKVEHNASVGVGGNRAGRLQTRAHELSNAADLR